MERAEHKITERVLKSIVQEIPLEWYDDDLDEVWRLAERLYNRRNRVPELP